MTDSADLLAAKMRSHPHVLDRHTGEWLGLDDYLGDDDYGNVVADKRVGLRLDLLEGRQRFVCPWCERPMFLASKCLKDKVSQRFYFKHVYDSGQCTGVRGLGAKAICARRFAQSKESIEHKRFKEWLLESLEADPAFSSTNAEKRWTGIDGVRWRQPDVQSNWVGQQVAFEAQLSTTFLHVIAERMQFYATNDGRLLWLFRDLDPGHFRLAEDDIFFSNNRNGFRVSEHTVALSRELRRFALECVWHEPTLEEGTLVDCVQRRVVFFDELTFDVSTHGVPRAFYFNYDAAKAAVHEELAQAQQEARDGPLRQAFEEFFIAYVRGQIEFETLQKTWPRLVAQFHQQGLALPSHPTSVDGPRYYLQAAYSAKVGQSVGTDHTDLVKMGHYLVDQRKPTLWLFRLMLEAYQRHEHMREHDPTGNWAKKAKVYRQAMRREDSAYLPDRRHDKLLGFLFPEVADKLVRHPKELLGQAPVD